MLRKIESLDAEHEVPLLKFRRPTLLLHPALIALLTWSTVAGLYILHLSGLLLYESNEVLRVCVIIVSPIVAVTLLYRILHARFLGRGPEFIVREEIPAPLLAKRLRQVFTTWLVLSVIETIVSGGVPLAWIVAGSDKTYFDYGIPSLHGMVQALLMALAISYFALYLYTGQKRYLRFPAFAVVWSLVEVSRATLIVLMLEYGVVLMRLRPIKLATLLRLAGGVMGLLLVFGYIGDFRTGAEQFKAIAQPTENFPGWAPSGFLWGYIYITTPLNNLLHTMHTRMPAQNPLFPATAATLFPTVVRNVIYGGINEVQDAQGGDLVASEFTVSTAYMGPFQDMGVIGIIVLSTLSGIVCEMYWHRHGFWNTFVFATFTQALILSLFYDLLLSLPILGQLPFFYWITRSQRKREQGWPGDPATA